MRKAKTVKGVLKQLKACQNCANNPALTFGGKGRYAGTGICRMHLKAYDGLEWDGRRFNLFKETI